MSSNLRVVLTLAVLFFTTNAISSLPPELDLEKVLKRADYLFEGTVRSGKCLSWSVEPDLDCELKSYEIKEIRSFSNRRIEVAHVTSVDSLAVGQKVLAALSSNETPCYQEKCRSSFIFRIERVPYFDNDWKHRIYLNIGELPYSGVIFARDLMGKFIEANPSTRKERYISYEDVDRITSISEKRRADKGPE